MPSDKDLESAYENIIEKIREGLPLSKEDWKFIKSYDALKNAEQGKKSTGNAGKRKSKRTGK